MSEIILYQFAAIESVDSGSPFCTKVHRSLAFKGLDYRVRNVKGPLDLRRLNPKCRKVPVLEYDGMLVMDSTKILSFLDAKHPEPGLYPADPLSYAQSQLVEDWADESLYWCVVYKRWAVDENFAVFSKQVFGSLPPLVRWGVPAMVRRGVLQSLQSQGIGRLNREDVTDMLRSHLKMIACFLAQHPFLVGETLTAADIAVFAPIQALHAPLISETRSLVREHPTLVEWLERVDEQTRGQHTVAVS